MPTENEALLFNPTRAPRGAKAPAGGHSSLQLFTNPFMVFFIITLMFYLFYHHYAHIVTLVIFCFAALGMLFISMSSSEQTGKFHKALGVLILLATFFGFMWGDLTYHKYFVQYFAMDENRAYTNVLPSEPAASRADAGKLAFADNARVDTTKAVGYMEGDVFCVAPIMDEMQAGRVEYWAAGVNCCNQRGSFYCDDAPDASAHDGVVLLDTKSWFAWFFLPSHIDKFEAAVGQAEAAFDLVSSPTPLFVRWVENPNAVQEAYLSMGRQALGVGWFMYLILSVLFSVAAGLA